jgi:hypothetical protein
VIGVGATVIRVRAVSRVRAAAAPLVGLAVLLSGCTTGGAAPTPPTAATATATPAAGGAEAEEPVRGYLDAMRAKDVAQGRAQLCPATREIFDTSATGPGGDFAEGFTVTRAWIDDSRPVAVGYQVTATVTVAVADATSEVGLLFTVTPAGDDSWCIQDETSVPPADGPTPTPAD